MKTLPALMLHLLFCLAVSAQTPADTSIYRAAADRLNDLQHTRLEITFDNEKACAYGKASITLSPHFYSTDSLLLDAKGMDIQKVALLSGKTFIPLKYTYDSTCLHIRLNKVYLKSERYTVYISYTARPNEWKGTRTEAAMFNKGMYFINPGGKEEDKPVQIWTHGEPQATSVWCPTIDQPNQRSTTEMYLTVRDKYMTVSNGNLISQVKHTDGTRTDYWKMDLAHAPYLFFAGVGNWTVVKDTAAGKEVNYYVEPAYVGVAKKIFGATPAMMRFFSGLTGIDYPWQKYAQIAVRDYFTGGMENTTITLFNAAIQQDERELADGNRWETNIAHELFHQWFGNYVTAESWSNLTLNESFARYGEVLWYEHKYGQEKAEELQYNLMLNYLYSKGNDQPLVRFYYKNSNDLFDAVSYNKGAGILHMLRKYVGDTAFFASLHKFLADNKFRSVEVPQLRMTFEEVTGLDLNWFFNQWYYGKLHPDLDIQYTYDDNSLTGKVIVKQLQAGQPFIIPLTIDVYNGDKVKHYPVTITEKEYVFSYPYTSRPDLVSADGDHTVLCNRKENKITANYAFQYVHGGSYVSKREAVNYWGRHLDDTTALAWLKKAMKDPFDGIRFHALMVINMKSPLVRNEVKAILHDLAVNETSKHAKARALELLREYNDIADLPVFKAAYNDVSYTVSGEALEGILKFDTLSALKAAQQVKRKEPKGKLEEVVTNILMIKGAPEDFDYLATKFDKMALSESKLNMLHYFAYCLNRVSETDRLKKGIDIIVRFRDAIPYPYKEQTDPLIDKVILKELADGISNRAVANANNDAKEQIRYINDKMNHL
jgi:aminopeptidase N